MRWRDIRFEKPTEADGDCHGEVAAVLYDGRKVSLKWNSTDVADMAHFWCPMSELPDPPDRIPDPPEGWRFVDKDKDARDDQAKFWDEETKHWGLVNPHLNYWLSTHTYIVPINPPAPPEPQYRPYNAAELIQTVGKLVDGVSGYRAMITGVCGDSVYCQGQRVPSDQLLKNHTWTDGGKCGVKVEQ
jgi:hypothetical protein